MAYSLPKDAFHPGESVSTSHQVSLPEVHGVPDLRSVDLAFDHSNMSQVNEIAGSHGEPTTPAAGRRQATVSLHKRS